MQNTDKKTFSKRFVAILPLLIIGLFAISGFLSTVFAAGISPSDVVSLANKARANEGLSPLTESEVLSRAAKAKAKDMFENDYFAHTSPKGLSPWHWIKKEGYQYKYAGENLAINYTSAKDQHNAWMKSKTHRDNILNGNYKEIGVAVVEGKIDGESSVVTVELFATPLRAAVGKSPAPVSPAVKGTETTPVAVSSDQAIVPILDAPVLDQSMNVSPISLEETAAVLTKNPTAMDRLALIMLTIIALSLALPPLVFLSQVYLHLAPEPKALKKGKEEKKENTSLLSLHPKKVYKIV